MSPRTFCSRHWTNPRASRADVRGRRGKDRRQKTEAQKTEARKPGRQKRGSAETQKARETGKPSFWPFVFLSAVLSGPCCPALILSSVLLCFCLLCFCLLSSPYF